MCVCVSECACVLCDDVCVSVYVRACTSVCVCVWGGYARARELAYMHSYASVPRLCQYIRTECTFESVRAVNVCLCLCA